jgi:hypothetical protein
VICGRREVRGMLGSRDPLRRSTCSAESRPQRNEHSARRTHAARCGSAGQAASTAEGETGRFRGLKAATHRWNLGACGTLDSAGAKPVEAVRT